MGPTLDQTMTVFARSGFSVVSLERVHELRYGSLTKWVQRIQELATPGLHVDFLGDSEFAEGLALCGPMPKREARTADRP